MRACTPFVADPHRTGWIASSLAALAVLQVGGTAWGWVEPGSEGAEQTSFLLSYWIVVDAAVVRPPRASAVVAGAVAATMVAHGAVEGFDTTSVWLAGLAFAYFGSLLLRTLGLTVVRLREAEGQLAHEAVSTERRHIAREVHDVVAHSLAVTALHLSAARMASERGDLAATHEAILDAERLTRASLTDLRQTVRLLRPADEATTGTEAALPGLEQLPEIVAAPRAAGVDADLVVDGDLASLDPLVGLTALRVVQEALTNAVRHQHDPRIRVEVTVAEQLGVTVSSRGPRRASSSVPGVGLVGMRERVEAAGGHLETGATDDGWVVAACLPIDATDPTDPSSPSSLDDGAPAASAPSTAVGP